MSSNWLKQKCLSRLANSTGKGPGFTQPLVEHIFIAPQETMVLAQATQELDTLARLRGKIW